MAHLSHISSAAACVAPRTAAFPAALPASDCAKRLPAEAPYLALAAPTFAHALLFSPLLSTIRNEREGPSKLPLYLMNQTSTSRTHVNV